MLLDQRVELVVVVQRHDAQLIDEISLGQSPHVDGGQQPRGPRPPAKQHVAGFALQRAPAPISANSAAAMRWSSNRASVRAPPVASGRAAGQQVEQQRRRRGLSQLAQTPDGLDGRRSERPRDRRDRDGPFCAAARPAGRQTNHRQSVGSSARLAIDFGQRLAESHCAAG